VEPGRVTIDLARVLERYGFSEVLSYLTFVELTTGEGRIILTVRAAHPGSSQ
jgi:predicted transglutaminase-like cysteine proteinase